MGSLFRIALIAAGVGVGGKYTIDKLGDGAKDMLPYAAGAVGLYLYLRAK